MRTERVKKGIKIGAKVLWSVLLVAIIGIGASELGSVWGVSEEGILSAISGLISLYIVILVWRTNHREILHGKEDNNSRRIQD